MKQQHDITIQDLKKSIKEANLAQEMLFSLIEKRDIANLKRLLEKVEQKPDVNSKNKDGLTPLTLAVKLAGKKGNDHLVKYLLNSGARPDIQGGCYRYTALILAAVTDNSTLVKTLLKAKANPNSQDYKRRTALMVAASKGNLVSVEALLAAGANPDNQDKHGHTALMLAVDYGQFACMQLLLKVSDINSQDNYGDTALMRAVENEALRFVTTLLEAGANPNIQGRCGNTPLIRATEKNNLAIMKALLNAKADATIKNNVNETALDVAKHKECKRLLKPPKPSYFSNCLFHFSGHAYNSLNDEEAQHELLKKKK